MRAALLALLLVAAARAGDEFVDIVPGWRKGDTCELVASLAIRARGKKKFGNVERAITIDRTTSAEYRDLVQSVTANGAPGSIERKVSRLRTRTVLAVAGLKSETKDETDATEGKTATVARDGDAFLIEMLEHEIYRKGAKVGETWDGPKEEDGKLTFKVVEVTSLRGQRVARIYVYMKAKISSGKGKCDVEVRGYVHFSLDAGRIIRASLRGPMKAQLEGFGTVHGTISEEATLAIVEAGGNPDSANSGG